MAHPHLQYVPLILGLVPVMTGTMGVLRPKAFLKMMNFPTSGDSSAQKTAQSMARLFGARSIALGYFFILLWFTGDEKLMGLGLLSSSGLTIVDGFIIKHQGGTGVWMNWGLSPVVAGVAAGLLGWY